MSRSASSLVTPKRLTAATLLVAGLLALPVVMRTPGSPTSAPLPAQTAAAAAVAATGPDAERQYSALEMEDRRLLTLVSSVRPGSGPYVQRLDGATETGANLLAVGFTGDSRTDRPTLWRTPAP